MPMRNLLWLIGNDAKQGMWKSFKEILKAKTIEDFIITTERVNSFSPAIKPSAYQPRMLSPQSRCFPLLREFGL